MEIVQNKEHLKEIFTKVNKNDLVVDISEIGEVIFFTTLNEFENLNFERLDFKKWKITQNNISLSQSKNRTYSYFLILIGILLNIFAVVRIILNNWIEIETKFVQFPILASITATIIISMTGLISKKIYNIYKTIEIV